MMMKEHGMSLTEIDDMIPFERQIFIAMILEYLVKKAQSTGQ